VAKILALTNRELNQRIKEYQEKKKSEIEKNDKKVLQNG